MLKLLSSAMRDGCYCHNLDSTEFPAKSKFTLENTEKCLLTIGFLFPKRKKNGKKWSGWRNRVYLGKPSSQKSRSEKCSRPLKNITEYYQKAWMKYWINGESDHNWGWQDYGSEICPFCTDSIPRGLRSNPTHRSKTAYGRTKGWE